jgi:membrane protein DedA with SNARE-associated domain
MLRRPLPGFILVNLLASVPKSAALFGIGYFAGNDYPLLARHSGLAMLGLTAVGVAAVVLVLRRADRIGAGG